MKTYLTFAFVYTPSAPHTDNQTDNPMPVEQRSDYWNTASA